MVESDCHTEGIAQGLRRMVDFDRLIRDTAQHVDGNETLIIFAADHSYDFRVFNGTKDGVLFSPAEIAGSLEDQDSVRLQNIRRDDDHTGEEVMVAAQGPGAERVRGVLSNTDLFEIMCRPTAGASAKRMGVVQLYERGGRRDQRACPHCIRK